MAIVLVQSSSTFDSGKSSSLRPANFLASPYLSSPTLPGEEARVKGTSHLVMNQSDQAPSPHKYALGERKNILSSKRRKHPCIKVIGHALNLALGEDIMLPWVVEMAEMIVVSHASRCHLGLKTVMEWVTKSWSNSLNQLSVVKTLTKGWFMLSFKKV
jgi:hypothetical protein